MINKVSRNEMRVARHKRVRSKIVGTPEIPRLCIYRSNKNISAQIIDDLNGITLVSASSLELKLTSGANKEVAIKVAEAVRKAARDSGLARI